MLRIVLLLIALCLLGTGCAVNEIVVADETELYVANSPVDESRLLDIGIIEFYDRCSDRSSASILPFRHSSGKAHYPATVDRFIEE